MHHKFCIIDDEILITGSYNWSTNAFLHYENIVITKNCFTVINAFKHEFADLEFMASIPEKVFAISKSLSTFNLGMISSPYGKYESSTLSVCEINIADKTFKTKGEIEFPNFFQTTEYSTNINDYNSAKEYYRNIFIFERNHLESIQKHFSFFKNHIHAVGRALIANQNAVYEYNEEPERVIQNFWVDIRFRKVIPSVIIAEDSLEDLWYQSHTPDL